VSVTITDTQPGGRLFIETSQLIAAFDLLRRLDDTWRITVAMRAGEETVIITDDALAALAAAFDRALVLVPERVEEVDAERPAQPPSAPTLTGDHCRASGGFTMRRTGTCMTCQSCGETTGCA
jgi:hypothetical protein